MNVEELIPNFYTRAEDEPHKSSSLEGIHGPLESYY